MAFASDMIKDPTAQIGGPPRREQSPQGERRTVFISRIPKHGITDDVLYADFTGFGRVLATKVFIPKTKFQGKPDKVVHFGAFIEFATDEAAMDVMNTLKEYRGVETGVKWAHRSLVESIKELRQRQVGNEADGRGMGGEAIQASTSGDGAATTADKADPEYPRYGTLYDENTEDAGCKDDDDDHDDEQTYQDPVGSFIQEQAQLWHQELRAYYAAGCTPVVLPPPASMGPPVPVPAPMLAPGSLPPPLGVMIPPMIHYQHISGMPIMHPAGLPITPVPPQVLYY